MSNYDGASKALDDLRSLIVRDDSGLAPLDITMLGRVAARLEYFELMKDHSRIRDTREGEWPEDGQCILEWSGAWHTVWHTTESPSDWRWWLPAPPSPSDD